MRKSAEPIPVYLCNTNFIQVTSGAKPPPGTTFASRHRRALKPPPTTRPPPAAASPMVALTAPTPASKATSGAKLARPTTFASPPISAPRPHTTTPRRRIGRNVTAKAAGRLALSGGSALRPSAMAGVPMAGIWFGPARMRIRVISRMRGIVSLVRVCPGIAAYLGRKKRFVNSVLASYSSLDSSREV